MKAKDFLTRIFRVTFVASLLASPAFLPRLRGASLTEIYGFNTPSSPAAGLVQAGDGNLYGTTSGGGRYGCGTVFKLTTNGDLTFLHSFDGADGAGPRTDLIMGLDGTLYGTTSGYSGVLPQNSPTNGITVFHITTNGDLTTLAAINLTNGTGPSELVQTSDGTLYGTCQGFPGDGLGEGGSVFSLTGGTNFNSLAVFNNLYVLNPSNGVFTLRSTNGYDPAGGLTSGNDGNLYGMNVQGGEFDYGTVYQITPAGSVTTIVNFDGTNGMYPEGKLVKAPDGSFFGLTVGDQSNSFGTIFRLTADGVLTNVIEFAPSNQVLLQSTLSLDGQGNLYCVTSSLDSQGVVFKATTNGTLSVLVSFNGTNGGGPTGGLTCGGDGKLYGTTGGGGAAGSGTAFSLTPNGQLNTLVSFPQNVGDSPNALIQGPNGDFYGTTMFGGVGENRGTIFKLSSGVTFTELVAMDGTNGTVPHGPLVVDASGGLYGFSRENFPATPGLFNLSSNGLLTFYPFSPTNSDNPAALLQGLDGALYGVGAGNFAKIFMFRPGIGLDVLVAATNTNLDWPTSLVQAGDGTLYGVASAGDDNTNTSIFKATTNGLASTLVFFPSNAVPLWISPGMDGNLYGMTMLTTNMELGFGGDGVVGMPLGYTFFQMTPDGAITNLTAVSTNSIDFSSASFVPGNDGSFYVLASGGNLFQFTTNGGFVPICAPIGGYNTLFLQGADGDFYGTSLGGGSRAGGYIFRLTLRPTIQAGIATNGTVNFTWDAIPSRQYQMQSSASLSPADWNNVGSPASTTNFTATAADSVGAASWYYRVVQLP